MVPEGEVWSLVEFPKVSPGVSSQCFSWRDVSAGRHCPERQGCPVGSHRARRAGGEKSWDETSARWRQSTQQLSSANRQ